MASRGLQKGFKAERVEQGKSAGYQSALLHLLVSPPHLLHCVLPLMDQLLPLHVSLSETLCSLIQANLCSRQMGSTMYFETDKLRQIRALLHDFCFGKYYVPSTHL